MLICKERAMKPENLVEPAPSTTAARLPALASTSLSAPASRQTSPSVSKLNRAHFSPSSNIGATTTEQPHLTNSENPKMVSSELGPQLQFLTDAAHLLSASSPETSAFLMSRRTALLVDNDVPIPDHQRQHVCSCCGHIMIPGQGTELKVGVDKALKARIMKRPKAQGTAATAAASSSQRPGVSKVFTCGKCSRYTKLQLPAPKPSLKARGRNKKVDQVKALPADKRLAATAAPAATAHTEPARLSANASSKKRAKNRKAGLQALLDQRSGQTSGASSGFGLSFSDFMKK